ncbi:hypothetical protein [Streptomyces sp. NRRL WC-3774]|nr:hypothetical protein [Streptomyces sp. NRRL WC-3774]
MDEIFDPEIHAVDKDGNPSLNKDGSFRKKRKDAGGGRKASAARPASPAGKVEADRRARYVETTAGTLQPLAAVLSIVDPVDGFCASQLVNPWSEVIADLALQYPQVAAALEKAQMVGPLSGLLGVGLMTFMQFGHNHGKVPAHMATMFGARPRTEIEQILKQRGEQLAAQAEQRAAEQDQAEHVAAYQEEAREHVAV